MARKIFLSFTSTLGLMANGTITGKDFENALFYFGCAKVHALGTPAEEIEELRWAFGDREEEGIQALRELQKALRGAEKAGRVVWRPLKGRTSQAQLNELLLRNNALPLNPNLPMENDPEFLAKAIIASNTAAGTPLLHPVY